MMNSNVEFGILMIFKALQKKVWNIMEIKFPAITRHFYGKINGKSSST